MVRPSQLPTTITKKLQPFINKGLTVREIKEELISTIGQKNYMKHRQSIANLFRNDKRTIKKKGKTLAFKSKQGLKKFKLFAENKQVASFIKEHTDVLGTQCAAEDFPTTQEQFQDNTCWLEGELKMAVNYEVLLKQSPYFGGSTWSQIVKFFGNQDPYWGLLQMQLVNDFNLLQREERCLFGMPNPSKDKGPFFVEASLEGLWRYTRATASPVRLPMDAPQLLRGAWLRDQILSYSELCKMRTIGTTQENFFKLAHLFLKGNKKVSTFKELEQFYRKNPSQLSSDFHQERRDAKIQSDLDDAIEEEQKNLEEQRQEAILLEKLEIAKEATREAIINRYRHISDGQVRRQRHEIDLLNRHNDRLQQSLNFQRKDNLALKQTIDDLRDEIKSLEKELEDAEEERSEFAHNLNALVPEMWGYTGKEDWYDSDISSQCGIEDIVSDQEMLPITLVSGDDWPTPEQREQIAARQLRQQLQPLLQLPQPPRVENIFRMGAQDNSRGTPPMLSDATMQIMRSVLSNRQDSPSTPVFPSLSPLQIAISRDTSDQTAQFEQSLMQMWNIQDSHQVVDIQDEEPMPSSQEMIPRRNNNQE